MTQRQGRIRTCIDRNWLFVMKDFPQTAGAQAEEFDDAAWQAVRLPHDWTVDCIPERSNHLPQHRVQGHLEWQSDSCLPKTVGWYRKYLSLDESLRGRRICLEFEGVFRNCTIWLNGQQVGAHRWGYTSFVLDVTEHVRFGPADSCKNVLAVRVDSTECEGWWCEGSGIYRHVWLTATHGLHVDTWGTFITTPKCSESAATVSVRTTVRNDGAAPENAPAGATLLTTLIDADGQVVARDERPICFEKDAAGALSRTLDVQQEMTIAQPRLWSPQKPNLYRAVSTIMSGPAVLDTYETTFGVRWFEFTADKGFFVNGKPFQIRGANIHHDFGGLGTGLPDRANVKTVEVLKEMGCNALRPGHIAATPALIDACDRLGLLFFAETRYMPLDEPAVTIPPLREMIRRDRNHPSIIVWTLGNASGGTYGSRYMTQWLAALNDAAHLEDPTRPTSIALENSADFNANGFALVTDLVGYNGGGMKGRDDAEHLLYPQRKIHISEYSGGRGVRGVYEASKTQYTTNYISSSGLCYRMRGEYFDIYNLCASHERDWAHVAERPWLAGGLMWAGVEYRGEVTGWPCVTSQFGPFDICRFRKDLYYFYKQEWCDEPMVHALPHWTWPDRQGKAIKVWCYSNCPQVELSLNGTSLGVKPSQKHGHVEWLVPYEPGTLTATGMKDGQVVCRHRIQTAGMATMLRAEADRSVIAADGCDLSFITISVHDGNGVAVPTADQYIKVEVSGAGRLIGLCSGDPRSHELAKSPVMRAFNGLLLAIVQSDDKPGPITLTARSEELTAASVELSCGDVAASPREELQRRNSKP